MFFFADFCTQCQCPGEKYLLKQPQSKWLHRSRAALSSLSLFGPCDLGAVQDRVFLFDACGFCAGCVSVMGVLQRRKQKAAKSQVLDQIKSRNLNGNSAPLSTFEVFVSP